MVKLVDFSHPPVPEVVEALERLLELARRGEVLSLAYVAELSGNACEAHVAPCSSVYLIGELRVLEHHLLATLAAEEPPN